MVYIVFMVIYLIILIFLAYKQHKDKDNRKLSGMISFVLAFGTTVMAVDNWGESSLFRQALYVACVVLFVISGLLDLMKRR